LGRKLIKTSLIAAVITLAFWFVEDMGLIDFRNTPKPWEK